MNQHATALEWNGKGFLFIGPPGCGKSTLAMTLIEQGATLIADDQVFLSRNNAQWVATCPEILQDKIYIRDIGIITVPSQSETIINMIFQSDRPAYSLSRPPVADIPLIQMDFMDIQAVNIIQTTLSCV